jgi:hypothetical protein
MAAATKSFPVPVSPVISTVMFGRRGFDDLLDDLPHHEAPDQHAFEVYRNLALGLGADRRVSGAIF